MKKILTGLLALLLITQTAYAAYAESPSESTAQPMQQETQDETNIKTQRPVLKAASYDVTKIKISWEADAGADGYILYRKAEGAKSYQKIYTAGSSESSSYIDIGRTCGKTYLYKMKAYQESTDGKVYAKVSQVKKAHARPRKPVITSLFEKKSGSQNSNCDGSLSEVQAVIRLRCVRLERRSGTQKTPISSPSTAAQTAMRTSDAAQTMRTSSKCAPTK